MKTLRVYAALCAIALSFVFSACNKTDNSSKASATVIVQSPTAPAPTTTRATDVFVTAPSASATLGQCPMYIHVSARVEPSSVSNKRVNWRPVTGTTPVDWTTDDDLAAAVLTVDRAGVYILSAKAQDNPDATMHPFTLTLAGNCTGINPNPRPNPNPNPPPSEPACSDKKDNDGDGKIDFTPPPGQTRDPGCTSPDDDDENDPTGPGPGPLSCDFNVTSPITLGNSSTFGWGGGNGAVSATAGGNLGNWSGPKAVSGSEPVKPIVAGTYNVSLTCNPPSGGAQAPVTVTRTLVVNSAPLQQPVCTSFFADKTNVPRGSKVKLTWTSNPPATQRVRGFTDWTRASLEFNGSEEITPNKATNFYDLECGGAPGTTPDVKRVTVTTFETAVCENPVDYNPPGGPLAMNQSKTLTVTVPSAECRRFWGVNRADRGILAGADGVEIRDGVAFPVGDHAVVKRIAPGDFEGFVQPSIVNTNKRSHIWTDGPAMMVEAEPGPPATAKIMFDEVRDGTGKVIGYTYKDPKTGNVYPVSQTGPR